MSEGGGIVITMTNKIAAATTTLLAALAAGVALAAPAQAAVNETSRVVAIDLPKALDKATTAMVILTEKDGDVMVVTIPAQRGAASVLVDNPADLAKVTVKVGKREVRPDHYMVTNLAPVRDAYGMVIGCPTVNERGEQVMVGVDGGLYTLSTGHAQPVAPVTK